MREVRLRLTQPVDPFGLCHGKDSVLRRVEQRFTGQGRVEAPFEALVGAIISQQISGKAAASIAAKLRSRVPLTPSALAEGLRLNARSL